jgi:hypothetical protein
MPLCRWAMVICAELRHCLSRSAIVIGLPRALDDVRPQPEVTVRLVTSSPSRLPASEAIRSSKRAGYPQPGFPRALSPAAGRGGQAGARQAALQVGHAIGVR